MTTPLTLNTTHERDGRIALIAVGEIDQSNVDAFRRALATATADASDAEAVIVDLSAVEYLDSAAINVLYSHTDRIKLIANALLIRTLDVSGLGELTTIDLAQDS